MIISNSKVSNGDIVSFKLQSGEEVIGKLVDSDMTSITVSKPLMLAMTQKGPAMAPLLMTVNPDSNVPFNKSCIAVGPLNTDSDVAGQYTYQTTGIQPVSAGSIVTG